MKKIKLIINRFILKLKYKIKKVILYDYQCLINLNLFRTYILYSVSSIKFTIPIILLSTGTPHSASSRMVRVAHPPNPWPFTLDPSLSTVLWHWWPHMTKPFLDMFIILSVVVDVGETEEYDGWHDTFTYKHYERWHKILIRNSSMDGNGIIAL